MPKPALFDPSHYRDLTTEDQALLQLGYGRACDALMRNVTPMGFSACSLNDNQVYGTDANYRSVWARDGAKTIIWTLDLDDEPIRACQLPNPPHDPLHQAPAGQLPAHVLIDTDEPEYGGVGGITSIDSALWTIIAVRRSLQTSRRLVAGRGISRHAAKGRRLARGPRREQLRPVGNPRSGRLDRPVRPQLPRALRRGALASLPALPCRHARARRRERCVPKITQLGTST